MGAAQSQISARPQANVQDIIEKAKAMELADEYVHVDEKDTVHDEFNRSRASWTPVSASRVEKWEHELLADPKNRYVYPPPLRPVCESSEFQSLY
jgi:bleomycin hydrolase